MKIGIVTTWFERGAAYVSRTYMDLLTELGHQVFIYARGGDGAPDKHSDRWNESYVTKDLKYNDTQVSKRKFFNWIKKNKLELILFNEQRHFLIVALTKKKFPNIRVGAYVDYYKEDTIPLFHIYDFVICNTRRHLQAMSTHPQPFYLDWGVDTELFKSNKTLNSKEPIFFHSVGMSKRKGTDTLINAFIDGQLYKKSKLIIHTQIPITKVCSYQQEELENFNINIVEKTVTAPGLYSMGNVYVYPTRLDGLGLTMYEAMSFGMPVITTDYPPMNEIVNNDVGSLVKVKDHYCRADAYFYPMSICDKNDLIRAMKNYIDHPEIIEEKGKKSRELIVSTHSLEIMRNELEGIINSIEIRLLDKIVYSTIIKSYKSPLRNYLRDISESNNYLRRIKGIFHK